MLITDSLCKNDFPDRIEAVGESLLFFKENKVRVYQIENTLLNLVKSFEFCVPFCKADVIFCNQILKIDNDQIVILNYSKCRSHIFFSIIDSSFDFKISRMSTFDSPFHSCALIAPDMFYIHDNWSKLEVYSFQNVPNLCLTKLYTLRFNFEAKPCLLFNFHIDETSAFIAISQERGFSLRQHKNALKLNNGNGFFSQSDEDIDKYDCELIFLPSESKIYPQNLGNISNYLYFNFDSEFYLFCTISGKLIKSIKLKKVVKILPGLSAFLFICVNSILMFQVKTGKIEELNGLVPEINYQSNQIETEFINAFKFGERDFCLQTLTLFIVVSPEKILATFEFAPTLKKSQFF